MQTIQVQTEWDLSQERAFMENLFCDIRPARDKLVDNYHLLFVISPADFESASHRTKWARIQKQLKGKMPTLALIAFRSNASLSATQPSSECYPRSGVSTASCAQSPDISVKKDALGSQPRVAFVGQLMR